MERRSAAVFAHDRDRMRAARGHGPWTAAVMPFDDAPSTGHTLPFDQDAVDAFVFALRRAPLDEAVLVAAALLDDGAWEPWMLPALLRIHRRRVVELLRRLSPLITAARPRGTPTASREAATVNARGGRRRLPLSDPCPSREATL